MVEKLGAFTELHQRWFHPLQDKSTPASSREQRL